MYRLNYNFENIFITQDCYTRVLKGHIDIANAVFPNDTYGKKRWLTVKIFLSASWPLSII